MATPNLIRAFPARDSGYLRLWNQGVISYTPGDPEWKVKRFFPNARFLQRLRDGRFAVAATDGLRFSRDEGVTWDAPVAISGSPAADAAHCARAVSGAVAHARGPVRLGAFKEAVAIGRPVVPICIEGTHGILPRLAPAKLAVALT